MGVVLTKLNIYKRFWALNQNFNLPTSENETFYEK